MKQIRSTKLTSRSSQLMQVWDSITQLLSQEPYFQQHEKMFRRRRRVQRLVSGEIDPATFAGASGAHGNVVF